MNILIVGAGFSGSVYARECAEAGHNVIVIDKREHIGGNAYDFELQGVRVHKYGPHIFHTSNRRVVAWLDRFTGWIPYQHKVKARLENGSLVPFPINRETIHVILGKNYVLDSTNFLTNENFATAYDYLVFVIGAELTQIFFERYTKKMWGVSLRQISPDVVKRVKLRFDEEDRYFPNDFFQAMPDRGYASMFSNILDHPSIEVCLGCPFKKTFENKFDYIFNSMAIDEYFDFEFGELPYRSIKFHTHFSMQDLSSGNVTINYTDTSVFTRETHWHNIPGHRLGSAGYVRTIEEPCSFEDNFHERYYPVLDAEGKYKKLYNLYKSKAFSLSNKMQFIGRCGTYQYLDMHQVISQSLLGVQRWLRGNSSRS